MVLTASFRYCADTLLNIRNNGCVGISRPVRRYIFLLGICGTCTAPHHTIPRSIPVRISRTLPSRSVNRTSASGCFGKWLIPIKFKNIHGRRKKSRSLIPSILFANVRSLFNKIEETSLLLRQHRIGLAFLFETWLNSDIPNESVTISDYNIYRKDRQRGSGGGIICYSKVNSTPIIIDEHSVPSLKECNSEIFPLFFRDISLLVIGIYHPFWRNKVEHESAIDCIICVIDFVLINEEYKIRPHVMLLGDFNDLSCYYDHIARVTDLKPIIDAPTRGTRIIDQLFTNIRCSEFPKVLSPIGRSDHCTIIWSPNISQDNKNKKIKLRKFTKSSMAGFFSTIQNTDWLSLSKSFADLDTSVEYFQCCLYSVYDYYFPLRTVHVRDREDPWMSLSLKLLINERDKAFTNGHHDKYLRLREEVIKCIQYLKSDYLEKAVKSGDARNLWRTIKKTGHWNKKSQVPDSLSCEDFNRYFVTNFQDDSDQLPSFSEDDYPEINLVLSEWDVDSQLRKLRRKSCGPESIPYWIFRDCHLALTPVITYLFNWSLSEKRVPRCFKTASVIPIPKNDKPRSVSDYRPISLVSTLSKVLERLVCSKWLIPSIKEKVNSNQFAYVPGSGKGTSVALTTIYLHILKHLDRKSGGVRVATVDISKAFDRLLHSSVVNACLRFELPSQLTKWIGSYLSSRSQRVSLRGEVSSWVKVPSGVAQGSVLGPVLFCLVMDSLSSVCDNSIYIKYADDLTILQLIREQNEDNLQVEINNVLSWCSENGLSLNFSKCFVMDVLTCKTLNINPIVLNDDRCMQKCSSLLLLGCYLSDDMRWSLHVDYLVKKASKRMYLLIHLKRANCCTDVIFKVYVTFIRPILLYAFPAFCNIPNYLCQKLLNIEKRAMRIVGVRLDQNTLFEAGEKICCRLFHNVSSQPKHPLREFFDIRECGRTTRTSNISIRRPRTKTSRYSNSFIRFCPS